MKITTKTCRYGRLPVFSVECQTNKIKYNFSMPYRTYFEINGNGMSYAFFRKKDIHHTHTQDENRSTPALGVQDSR